MSLLLLFIITGMGPWIQYYKVGFFKFQPNKYGPPISFRPFMPLYGRQLQSGTHNALIGPWWRFLGSENHSCWKRYSQMSAMEENANTVKVLLGHTYFHAHASKNKTHAFNFYAVFIFLNMLLMKYLWAYIQAKSSNFNIILSVCLV